MADLTLASEHIYHIEGEKQLRQKPEKQDLSVAEFLFLFQILKYQHYQSDFGRDLFSTPRMVKFGASVNF